MTNHDHEAFLLSREQFGMRFGLERMRRLLEQLEDPQKSWPAVHVVGTNGKSTTTLMIGAALRAQRLSVGCFTSPHIRSFRERIDLVGEPIAQREFDAAAKRVRAAIASLDAVSDTDDRVTQFEAVTAIAFCAFAAAGVDVAVVEAGLGGRLDATNTLDRSIAQVLTGVGIDHTQYLGGTIEEIAGEKLAVVRSNGILITGPLGRAAELVANAVADERDAALLMVRSENPVFSDLPGGFVRRNASLALVAAESAFSRLQPGTDFAIDAATSAISDLAHGSRLDGRMQIVNLTPFELRDSAHNEQAAEALAAALPEVAGDRPITLLVALLSDKASEPILAALQKLLPSGGAIVCTEVANPRSRSASELADAASHVAPDDVRVEVVKDPLAALSRAREIAGREGALVVTGSNYLLADLLRDPAARAGATL